MSWGLCKEASTICSDRGPSGPTVQCTRRVPGARSLPRAWTWICSNILVIQKSGHIQEHPLRFVKKKKPIDTLTYVRNCLEASSWSLVESRGQHVTRRPHPPPPTRATASQGFQNKVTQHPPPIPLPQRQTLKCCDSFLKQLHGLAPGPRTSPQGSTSHRL